MATSPKEHRFIDEAIERFGAADQVVAYRSWRDKNAFVLEQPSEVVFPHDLVRAAVASLSLMSDEMDKLVMLDDEESAEHDNDRYYVEILRNSLAALIEQRSGNDRVAFGR